MFPMQIELLGVANGVINGFVLSGKSSVDGCLATLSIVSGNGVSTCRSFDRLFVPCSGLLGALETGVTMRSGLGVSWRMNVGLEGRFMSGSGDGFTSASFARLLR